MRPFWRFELVKESGIRTKVFEEEDLVRFEQAMDYWRIPGAVFAVFRKGEPAEMHCLGYKNIEAKTKPDPSTRFCMASVSKSYTSALISILCDERKLDLDRPVTDFVPGLQYREKAMSLKDMMSHRSGLANHDALWPGEQTKAEVAQQMRYLDSNLPFRSKYQYNNTQYVMAGYAAEYVTGKSFEELVTEYLLNPIGMTETTATERGIKASGNMAEPYRVLGTSRHKLPFWNMDMAAPAAGVNSTLNDMVKWVRFHLSGGVTEDGKRIISEKLFREIHTAHIAAPDVPVVADDPLQLTGYGLGWRIGTYRGTPLQMHNGKIEGYSSSEVYLPEKGVGFVIMINLHDPELGMFRSVMYDALDRAAFGMESDWLPQFLGEGEHAGSEAYKELLDDYTTPDYMMSVGEARPLAEYVGTYRNGGYGMVKVYEEDGHLMLHYRDQDLPLVHVGGDRFYMDGVKEDTWILRVPAEFMPEEQKVLIKYDPALEAIPFEQV